MPKPFNFPGTPKQEDVVIIRTVADGIEVSIPANHQQVWEIGDRIDAAIENLPGVSRVGSGMGFGYRDIQFAFPRVQTTRVLARIQQVLRKYQLVSSRE